MPIRCESFLELWEYAERGIDIPRQGGSAPPAEHAKTSFLTAAPPNRAFVQLIKPVWTLGFPFTYEWGPWLMELSQTFDKAADLYEKYRPCYVGQLFDDIFSYARIDGASRLVEIGIGTGHATKPFLETGALVTAVEQGEALSNLCRQKFAECKKSAVFERDCEVLPASRAPSSPRGMPAGKGAQSPDARAYAGVSLLGRPQHRRRKNPAQARCLCQKAPLFPHPAPAPQKGRRKKEGDGPHRPPVPLPAAVSRRLTLSLPRPFPQTALFLPCSTRGSLPQSAPLRPRPTPGTGTADRPPQ